MHGIRKSSQHGSRRLAEIHHRQAVNQRNLENGYRLASPGGTGLNRQVVHQKNPENAQNGICCLTTIYSPPGGFWKISRTQKNHRTIEVHA